MKIRFFFLLLLMCCGISSAHAAGGIAVRAGTHADHDRLVIDPATAHYQLSGTAPDYQITFDAPLALVLPDVSGLKRIQSVDQPSPTQLAIHVKPGQHIKVSRLGNKLVIDAEAGQDAPPKESDKKTASATAAKASPVQVTPWSESQDTGGPPPSAVKKLSGEIAGQMAAMNGTPPADKKPDAPKAADNAIVPQAPTGNVGPGGRPLTLAELAARDAVTNNAAKAANTTTATAAPAADADKPPAEPQAFTPLPIQLPTPTAVGQIKLVTAKDTKFAAFMRGQKFWVVLDQPTLTMPTDETGAEPTKFGPVTRYQVGQNTGTAYRIQLHDNQFPSLTKSDDGVLLFTLYSEAPLVMPVGLPVEVENSPDSGPRLKITALGLAPPLPVSDPDVGDELFVIPTSADAGTVTDTFRWPQVGTIGALHGVVIEPFIDNLLVDTNNKGAIIGRPPKGLTLSGIKGLVDRHDKGNGELIFDFSRWRMTAFENFRWTRAQLESTLADIRGSERLDRIMQLARFMFAQGYPQEANGWLNIAAQEFPTAVNIPEYILLRGAIHVAMRDIFPADRDLSLSGYAYEPEVALWRGWAAEQNEDYARARYFFGLARDLLNDYPDPYFKPIAMAAAETALLTGDAVAGGALISRLEAHEGLLDIDKAQLHYLTGLQDRLNGQEEDAVKQWKIAAKGPNKIYAAKSELALVQEGLQQKTLKPEDAIKRLDKLRYAWRGDNIELTTLVTLAPLYIDHQEPRAAFECWQTIIRYFPNDPAAETARQSISNNLTALFAGDPQQMQKPIETLALYHDFINYAPNPQVQEDITRHLVDNMTAVGLYDEAAAIFLPLVEPKPDPNAPDAPLPAVKPEDVLRLAGIYLLDSQGPAARNVLKTVDRLKLTPEQTAEYQLLSARADFQDNKLDDALAELGNLNDVNANRIRSDIDWRQQKWPEAAKVLRSLLGDVPPDAKLTDEQTRNILEQAVALSLAGDQAGISTLRAQYAAMMDKTDQAAAFRLVTLPPKGSEAQSIRSIQTQLGDVDGFASFLQGYRKLDAMKPAPVKADATAAAPVGGATTAPAATTPTAGVAKPAATAGPADTKPTPTTAAADSAKK